MDMFFILLVFYLMVHGGTKPVKRSPGLPLPEGVGEANTVIQIIDADHYLWLDSAAIQIFANGGRQALNSEAVVNPTVLARKIAELVNFVKSPDITKYLVLIRCPDDIHYVVVRKLIDQLDEGKVSQEKQASLFVSLIGGSADDIRFVRGSDNRGPFLQAQFSDE